MPVSDQQISAAKANLLAWLRYHMAAGELDQQGLAEELGVSKGLVTQWFNGTGTKSLPSFKSLMAIAAELKVGIDVLLHVPPPPRPK